MTTTRPRPNPDAMWSKVLPSNDTAGAMASVMDAKHVDASLFDGRRAATPP
jgi:hypothetical protein